MSIAFGSGNDSGKVLYTDSGDIAQREIDLSKIAYWLDGGLGEDKKKIKIETWLDFRDKKHRKWIENATVVLPSGVFPAILESTGVRSVDIDGEPFDLYQYFYKSKVDLGSLKSGIVILRKANVTDVKFLEGKKTDIKPGDLLKKWAKVPTRPSIWGGGYHDQIEIINKDLLRVRVTSNPVSKSEKGFQKVNVQSCQLTVYNKFKFIDCADYRFLAENEELIGMSAGERGTKKLAPLILFKIDGLEHLIIRGNGDIETIHAFQKKDSKWIPSETIKIWHDYF